MPLNFTPPLRGSRRGRAVCAKADSVGGAFLWHVPPPNRLRACALSSSTPPQGGSDSGVRLKGSNPRGKCFFNTPANASGPPRRIGGAPVRGNNPDDSETVGQEQPAGKAAGVFDDGAVGGVAQQLRLPDLGVQRPVFRKQIDNANFEVHRFDPGPGMMAGMARGRRLRRIHAEVVFHVVAVGPGRGCAESERRTFRSATSQVLRFHSSGEQGKRNDAA